MSGNALNHPSFLVSGEPQSGTAHITAGHRSNGLEANAAITPHPAALHSCVARLSYP